MAKTRFNHAGGYRRLGVRQAASQVRHQTEAAAGIDAAMKIIFDAVHELARAHKKLGAAELELADANRIACAAEHEPATNAQSGELEAVAS